MDTQLVQTKNIPPSDLSSRLHPIINLESRYKSLPVIKASDSNKDHSDKYNYINPQSEKGLIILPIDSDFKSKDDESVLITNRPDLLDLFIAEKVVQEHLACREIKQIDNLFNYFGDLRDKVLENLVTNPENFMSSIWKPGSALSRDWKCQVQMGKHQVSLEDRLNGNQKVITSQRYFKCNGCQLIQVITSLKQALSGRPFSPECGENVNLKYIILSVNDVVLKYDKESIQADLISDINSETSLAQACQPNLSFLQRARYFSLDPFTNRILITWYLETVLAKKNLPNLRKLHYPFICQHNGYFLMEANDYFSINKLEISNSNQIWSILFQLFALFHRLKEYDLSFQEINEETIVFDNNPCQYQYDDMNITGSFTLKLNDLSRAGITLAPLDNPAKPVRIYSSPDMNERNIAKKSRKKSMNWVKQYELAKSPGENAPSWVSYIIDQDSYMGDNFDSFLYANRMGLPLYQSSFDLYRIMLLLLSNSQFYHFIINDSRLNRLWHSFWLPSEYEIIMSRLNNMFNNISSDDYQLERYHFNKLLIGLHLRCSLVNHIWSLLKEEANFRATYNKS